METEQPQQTRKGRSNAILTYETVEHINRGVQRLEDKLDHWGEKLAETKNDVLDHEVRLRAVERLTSRVYDENHEARLKALELSSAAISGGRGAANWMWHAIWPIAACVISLLNYLLK